MVRVNIKSMLDLVRKGHLVRQTEADFNFHKQVHRRATQQSTGIFISSFGDNGN